MHTIETKEKWQEIVESMDDYDFYHTYDYHFISKKEDELPILIVYEENDTIIALPFQKRPILGTPFFDLTSVYGYSGPISKNIDDHFDNNRFVKELNDLLKKLNVISIFSRLHPYIYNQRKILKILGDIEVLGKVVNIDVSQDLAVQRSQYGKSTKNRTNKCRKLCTVKKAISGEEVNTFIDIYYENMDRLSANKDYYFSRTYFLDFLKCKDFETDILLVVHNESNEVIAGSMFVKTKNIVQFHLSGSRTEYLNLAPANLFIDEMRIRATEEGYKIFNLGGGLGSKEDSLFKFKSSFSKNYHDFAVWKYVVDQKIYHELSNPKEDLKLADPSYNNQKDSTFFPLYRA